MAGVLIVAATGVVRCVRAIGMQNSRSRSSGRVQGVRLFRVRCRQRSPMLMPMRRLAWFVAKRVAVMRRRLRPVWMRS